MVGRKRAKIRRGLADHPGENQRMVLLQIIAELLSRIAVALAMPDQHDPGSLRHRLGDRLIEDGFFIPTLFSIAPLVLAGEMTVEQRILGADHVGFVVGDSQIKRIQPRRGFLHHHQDVGDLQRCWG